LADIRFSSTTIPKMLMNLQTHRKSITYIGCLTQVSFFFPFWMFGLSTLVCNVL
jgi:olfactory receptor